MHDTSNTTLPRSIAAMVGAIATSVFLLGLTTVSGPIALTLAAAPIA